MKAFQLTFQYSIPDPKERFILSCFKKWQERPKESHSNNIQIGDVIPWHFRCTKGESDFWQNTYTFTYAAYAVKLYQIFNDFHGHKVRWLNFTSHQLNLTNLYMIFNAAVCQNSLISINFQMKNKFCKFCFFCLKSEDWTESCCCLQFLMLATQLSYRVVYLQLEKISKLTKIASQK